MGAREGLQRKRAQDRIYSWREVRQVERIGLFRLHDARQTTANAALDLINHQKAEIEKLKEWENLLKAEKHSLIKTEAIKEFAGRLKCGVPQEYGVIRCSDIDSLVKEMVGDNDEAEEAEMPETINIEKYINALNNLLGSDNAYYAGDPDVDAIMEVIMLAKKLDKRVKELTEEKE